MFRRYPYWGWLLLSVLLWCMNGYQFHLHREAMLPEKMAQIVNNDLHHREEVFEKFQAEHDLIRRMFSDSLSDKEFYRINNLPFFIYGYENEALKFWNTNIVVGEINDSAFDQDVIVRNEKGIFLQKSLFPFAGEGNKKMVILFPVLITYPLENNYLRSHFAASDNIPVKTKIIPGGQSVKGSYPVTIRGNTPVFSLYFKPQDIQKWSPDILFIVMLIAALLASISWIQLMTIHITRKTSPLTGFLITIGIISVLLYLFYSYELPFNLDTLTFFDPSLYASNTRILSSFGALFIDTLFFLWIIVFITRHTPYKTYFEKIEQKNLRYLIAVVLVFALFAYMNTFVSVIHGLVRDSNISFDVSHFYAINIYTILGLLVIGGITGLSCLTIYLLNLQLKTLLKNKWVKYLLIALTGVTLVLARGFYNVSATPENPFDWVFYWLLFAWLFLFIILLDLRNFSLVSDLFEPHMVFWAIFICLFCTSILQYFNQEKERESRKEFVKNYLAPQRNFELEVSFNEKAKEMDKDKAIKNFFYKPSLNSRKITDQRFNTQYLSDPLLSKYQTKVYLFDTKGRGLYNKDTTGYATLVGEKNESDSTNSSYLFYKEAIHDRHYYYSYIPLYSDSTNKVIGYVIMDLDLKKQVSGTVYPELLQSADKQNTHDNEYAVAIYINDKLNTQTNDYPFATHLKNDALKEDFAYNINNGISELYYRQTDKRTIVVVHYHSEAIEMITLFSYIFVIQVLMASIILLYQLYLSYFASKLLSGKFMRLTLRRRVHFSMLAVVLLSFIIIGFVTILFFKNQYQLSNAEKLQSAMQLAKQSVQDDLKREQAYLSNTTFDTVTRSSKFKSFITLIANGQKIDLNIFNNKGVLVNTSEDDIYEKGLISRIMRPDAYFQLNDQGKSILIQDENIAGLPYLSAYLPLRDDQGITMGYINVPFFSSQKDLNFQISNIVVTLINLYAFIFLISSLITVLITRWITGSFNVIIKQFGMLNLQRNERILWPYDDEIGLLVSEYNKMVNKVEANAALLAQSERESAWREMARQVAHEIKNPLTPMKLNIQFLQQAMKNDNPNIKELTDKVSGSIIEQIDNLSYIASEFSNFAKMPEARPEELELSDLLNLAVKLYLDDAHIKVAVNANSEKLLVYSDRSQLLRVFTNLLENAIQSIPAGKTGNIVVSIKSENNDVVVSITDNGTGINEDVAQKIFQPYFTTKSSGTGLGLAMTKKIIEFWKGEIWFETKEGEGTTFYIRLPLLPMKA